MPTLYNCKHNGDQYRISKFNSDFNVEASYLCNATACECPAGHRPSCRHRQMLPKFIARGHVGDGWFFDHDRGGWVQGWKEEPTPEPELTIAYEVTLPANATGNDVANAFGNLLAPAGLGQASDAREPIEQKNDLHALRYSAGVAKVSVLEPSPSSPLHSPTIRRRV